MAYEKAIKQSLETPWILSTCNQGESCWCRVIKCNPSLMYKESEDSDEEEFYPVGSGQLHKEIAEQFVHLHNNHLKVLEVNDKIRKYFKKKENELK